MAIANAVRHAGEGSVAGIDIGGTKITVGIVNEAGAILVRADASISVEDGPKRALADIVEILNRQVQQTGIVLAGIGIGCTGPADPITGELGDVNTLPGWVGWNPVADLSNVFGVSAALENDADAAALGEARWGVGRGKAASSGLQLARVLERESF